MAKDSGNVAAAARQVGTFRPGLSLPGRTLCNQSTVIRIEKNYKMKKNNNIAITKDYKSMCILMQVLFITTLCALIFGCAKPRSQTLKNELQSLMDERRIERPIFKIKLLNLSECKEKPNKSKLPSDNAAKPNRTTQSILKIEVKNSKEFECFGGTPKSDYQSTIHVEYKVNEDGSTSGLTIGANTIPNLDVPKKISESIHNWKFGPSSASGPDLIKTTYMFE